MCARLTLALLLSLVLSVPPDAQVIEELGEAPPLEEADPNRPTVFVDAGLAITSRLFDRGINLGEAPQVQPRRSLNGGDFQASLWGSHPIAQASDECVESPRDATYREVLFWALDNLDVGVGVGTLTPFVQNHFNPNTDERFDFGDEGDGAHSLQAQLMFSGDADTLPVDALVGWVVSDDPGDSIYVEGGYRFEANGLAMRAFAGA